MNRYPLTRRGPKARTWPTLLVCTAILYGCAPAPDVATTRPFVRGYIATSLPLHHLDTVQEVYVSEFEVFAKNAQTGTESYRTRTDLSGRFTIRDLEDGRYNICWESADGYVAACGKTFSIEGKPVHLSKISVSPQKGKAKATLFGQVTMADGSSARRLTPSLDINSYARVHLFDDSGTELRNVPVNNFGDYVLPLVPGDAPITLRAVTENETREQPILVEANLEGAPFHNINLRFSNSPPRLEGLVPADSSGKRVQAPAPGSTVELVARAQDPEGDAVSFRWTADSGTLSSTTGDTVQWKLPAAVGRYAVRVAAFDSKGGYAESALSLRVDGKGARFSGKVRGTDTPAVPGAKVDVNGTTATTGADGYFSVFTAEKDRYVLTIRAPGYAFVSKIYDGPHTGGSWTLLRATQSTVDPTQDIVLNSDRSSRDCPGRATDRIDWKRFPNLLKNPQYQDGRSIVVPKFDRYGGPVLLPERSQRDRECGRGISVEIPANSIVDGSGNPPAGLITVSLATVDLESPDQMPGDFTATRQSGGTTVMQSYGAGFVTLDQGGMPLNLKPGSNAKITIPVDSSQLAAPGPEPASIPLLSYDETAGVWREEGVMNLVGDAYVGTVEHFSAINADTLKEDQSCVRVLSPALPGSYRMEVTVPQLGGAAPKVLDRPVDQSTTTEHVIYNLPENTNITLVPYDPVTDYPYGIFVVNTGGKQNPTDPNLPAGPPYDACATEVTLDTISLPPAGGPFLEGLFSFEATNLTELAASDPANPALGELAQAAQDYYDQADPCSKRTTLPDFIATNNFAGGDPRAVYANNFDLGFGRDMTCTQDGINVACYVSNYGSEAAPDQDDANDALADNGRFATVAMEFSPIETVCDDPATPGNEETLDAQQTVKFFTYNAAGDALLLQADLDGEGARPLPQLCLVCHGGAYPSGPTVGTPTFASLADVKLGSRFLPFDTAAFVFPNTDVNFNKANQQADIQALNDLVAATEPAGSSVRNVIGEMYPGGTPQDQDEDFFLSGWAAEGAQQDMYRHVIARSCRTCHVTNPVGVLEFNTHADFSGLLGSVEARVCVQGVMPHAKRTHELFWTSIGPSQVAQLQSYGDTYGSGTGWVGDKCGEYTAGGSTPVTLFSGTIQPIFEGVGSGTTPCTACHTGSSPDGNMRLDAGFSYAELVNEPAQSTGVSMDRVEPGNTGQSFLVFFINGNPGAAGYGGPFAQMAPGGSPNAASINSIEAWITGGADP